MTSPTHDPELEGFLALLAGRRAPRTVEAYQRDLTQLGAWLGKPVGEATTEDLERWLAEMRADGLAASTESGRAFVDVIVPGGLLPRGTYILSLSRVGPNGPQELGPYSFSVRPR